MANSDLYQREIVGPYQKLCGGGTNDGSMEDCLTIAPLAGGDAYEVRDSKLGEQSPALRFSRQELINLGQQAVAGQL